MKRQSGTVDELVSLLPDPDEQGMLTNIDTQKVDEIIAQIYKGGSNNISGLIEMLAKKDEGQDFKPRYGLHWLTLYVCKLKEEHRRAFTEALAKHLEAGLPLRVKKYIVQELQMVGGEEVIVPLARLLEDKELYEPAVLALTAIGGDRTAEQLRSALPKARGRRRLTIVLSLGVLQDVKSVKALRRVVNSKVKETRLAAVWALANIGDPDSVDLVLKAADTPHSYQRIKATHACLILAENLLASGNKEEAGRIYIHLAVTRTDPAEQYVRHAAKKGLATVIEDKNPESN